MSNSIQNRILSKAFLQELQFQTSKSGGPGGQHVNKVETKVQLSFDVSNSALLSDQEKRVILEKLKNYITNNGQLQLQSQEKRSQLQNREIVIKKFEVIIKKALSPVKKRVATKPGKGAIERRLKSKKSQSEKKANRKFRDL